MNTTKTSTIARNNCTKPNDDHANVSKKNDLVSAEKEKAAKGQEDSQIFTIPIYKKFKLRICKPLIPLKLALFMWYGAGSALSTFLLVFYKQRGLTLSELSTIFIITPVVQLLGPMISGIIADKIGKSKPVLTVNILLTAVIVAGMLLTPSMNLVTCDPQMVELNCNPEEYGKFDAKTSCDVSKDVIEFATCNVTCPDNITQYCDGNGLICEMIERNEHFSNISLSVPVSWAYKMKNRCYYNFTSMSYKNRTYSWCSVPREINCKIDCLLDPEEDCVADNSGRSGILILNTVLLVLFYTVNSNTYRFMDVTTMFLVKEHNCDLGVQRVFAVAGILVITPFVGYIIDAYTAEGDEKNYDMAVYIFIGMAILVLAVVYKLEVQIKPPGKNMLRKSLYLLKNPDVVSFALVLMVLGTAWNFNKNFLYWYLEGMNAPSFLLGLISSINALYGLPFLLTSHWWVKKIGTTHMFLLALLGYVIGGVGYSFIYDSRLSLLIEASNIFTYHLLWVAVVTYSHSIAPDGLTATVISTAGSIHFSIGKGTGGLIGGHVMNAFGGRIAFRVMALICFTTAVLYVIYLYARMKWCTKNNSLDLSGGIENAAFENAEKTKESYVTKNNS